MCMCVWIVLGPPSLPTSPFCATWHAYGEGISNWWGLPPVNGERKAVTKPPPVKGWSSWVESCECLSAIKVIGLVCLAPGLGWILIGYKFISLLL